MSSINLQKSYQNYIKFYIILIIITQISFIKCNNHNNNINTNNHNHNEDDDDETKTIINLEGKVGSYIVFNCRVDFPYDYEIPYVVHWSKEGQKIFTWYDGEVASNDFYAGRLSIVENNEEYGKASVNLTSIRESDQGQYHCQIMFPNRTPSIRNNGTLYQLTVEGGYLIKIPPINQTILEGQTAFFPCVMKYPDSSMVTWYKDGEPLKELPDIQRRSRIGPEGSLSIDPTMMSDLGEYECNIRNTDEEVQTAKAFLNIQYRAKVIYSPPEVYLTWGQPATLDCHFRSNPPMKDMRWDKDGHLFDADNVPGVFYKPNNGSLYFTKVMESHGGRYTCTPFNELGSDGPSPIINVIVQRPPIFTIQPKPIYIQKLGDTIELICDAVDRDGYHRPAIVWSRKDGADLPIGRHTIEGGNLTIQLIAETDRGVYECAVTNKAATVVAETELMIENLAASPPYNLTANSTDTEITISWQPGYIRPNLEYTVWYRLAEAAEWRTLRISSQTITQTTISNLLPGRKYEFMVLSQDQSGDGMFSRMFQYSTKFTRNKDEMSNPIEYQRTLDRVGPPVNLTVEQKGDGYKLNWDYPRHGAEHLRMYTVKWWQEPGHQLHGTADTIETKYFIRFLKDNENYRMQVFSVPVTGKQVGSNEVVVTVPSHRKMKAFAIGTAVTLVFLVTAIIVILYVKKNCCNNLKSNSVKLET